MFSRGIYKVIFGGLPPTKDTLTENDYLKTLQKFLRAEATKRTKTYKTRTFNSKISLNDGSQVYLDQKLTSITERGARVTIETKRVIDPTDIVEASHNPYLRYSPFDLSVLPKSEKDVRGTGYLLHITFEDDLNPGKYCFLASLKANCLKHRTERLMIQEALHNLLIQAISPSNILVPNLDLYETLINFCNNDTALAYGSKAAYLSMNKRFFYTEGKE